MKKRKQISIIKADGERQQFDRSKLEQSLNRAGASTHTTQEIVDHIENELQDGMHTAYIYRHAFSLLRRLEERTVAARYSIRRSVLELGPSGYPFEIYIAEIFKGLGYTTETQQIVKGKCATHEVDMIAHNDTTHIGAEIKFHNSLGIKTDLKVALYVEARFRDIFLNSLNNTNIKYIEEGWLITNTKFTQSAIEYARCVKMNLLGWNYPKNRSLHDLIYETRVYPITCLSTLTYQEKLNLLSRKHVLCKDFGSDIDLLKEIGVKPSKIATVVEESQALCTGDYRIE